MANYTQHYQLHQWEPEDSFLRTDFNADLEKIDTALHETNAKLPHLAAGTYTGTDTFGQDYPCSLSFSFKPTMVVIFSPEESAYNILCLPGVDGYCHPIGSSSGVHGFTSWQGNTVQWYNANSVTEQFNRGDKTYYYLAV